MGILIQIAVLLQLLGKLKVDPRVTVNPQSVAIVQSLTQEVLTIQSNYIISMDEQNTNVTPVETAPTPTDNATPEGSSSNPSGTPDNSSPVPAGQGIGAEVAPVTPVLNPIDISLVLPNFQFATSFNVAYFDLGSPTPSYQPYEIKIEANNETVIDPAFPDGQGGNLTFKGLTPNTTYPYTLTLTGKDWIATSTGEFTTSEQ